MPKTYEKNKFDLAGFAVGVVEKKSLLSKNKAIQSKNAYDDIFSTEQNNNSY